MRPAVTGDDENAIPPDPFGLPGDTPKKAVKKTQPKKPADQNASPFGDDEDEQPAAAPADKKPGKAGKADKKPPKAATKKSDSDDPFGPAAKPAEKPEKPDGTADPKGKKKGSLIGGLGKAIGKAIGGAKKSGDSGTQVAIAAWAATRSPRSGCGHSAKL